MALSDQIIGAESGGNPLARNPRSSATGAGQFIERTWIDTLSKHRPDLVQGKSRDEILALRSDPALSKAMTEAYGQDNAGVLQRAGLPVTPGTTYLAHFAGAQGATNLLRADPGASAAEVLGPAAARANPFLARMSVGDLRNWASRKMGEEAPPRPPMPIPNVPDVPQDAMAQAVPGAPPAQGPGQQGPDPQGAPQLPAGLPQGALGMLSQGMGSPAGSPGMPFRPPQGAGMQQPPQPGLPPGPDPQQDATAANGGMLQRLIAQILQSPAGGGQLDEARQRPLG